MTGMFLTFVAVVAILATILTAGAVGAGRGQATVAGEIVICSGGAAVTISLDAEGNPTGPAHWCPDCVLTLLAGLSVASVVPAPPAGLSAAWRASFHAGAFGVRLASPQARGPPAV